MKNQDIFEFMEVVNDHILKDLKKQAEELSDAKAIYPSLFELDDDGFDAYNERKINGRQYI